MSEEIAVIISPNWQDYAAKYLEDCLASLAAQDYAGGFKLWLIDNASSQASLNLLQTIAGRFWPAEAYTIIANQANDGFAKGNNEALRQILAQNFTYAVLFNMDTVIDKNCLSNLVAAAETDQTIGAVQARLMMWPEQETINSLGNVTHFLGFGYCNGYKESIQNSKLNFKNLSDICYPSGAAVLLRVEALKQVGLFDEEFWMYNEDQDLGWRLALAGRRSVLAPSAVVYHKYEFSKSIKQYYWLDRNRLLAIFKNYRAATLILIAPALAVMELGLFLFAVRGGWLKEKLKVYLYWWQPRTWRYLIRARRQSQALRRVSDRQIVKLFSGRILYQEIDNPWLRLANIFFGLYWRVVKIFILW